MQGGIYMSTSKDLKLIRIIPNNTG
jgi:hypothetical protein